MINNYGYTLHAACKLAKISKTSAKYWLSKMKENEGELIVKYANPIFNPNKASQIERIKKFIDKN